MRTRGNEIGPGKTVWFPTPFPIPRSIPMPKPETKPEPIRLPEREPERVPVPVGPRRKEEPLRHLPIPRDQHSHWLQEIPYECPRCGQDLMNIDDNSLACPSHGIVFQVEP